MTKEEKLNALSRFRVVSITEGISMLVLVFIAMPLKYIFELPLMVTYVGWIHGVLFMVYMLVLFPTSRKLRWTFRTALMGVIAAVLPFGPFLFDRKLKKQEHLITSSH
jgi:integral membrane protein